MEKGSFVVAPSDHTTTVPVDRIPDRNNAAIIPKLASPNQFKCFVNEIKLLLGGAEVEKCMEKDVPSTFLTGNLFMYPLALRVGFKLPLHHLVAEFMRRTDVPPHRVVLNTWRVLAVVLI